MLTASMLCLGPSLRQKAIHRCPVPSGPLGNLGVPVRHAASLAWYSLIHVESTRVPSILGEFALLRV